LQFQFIKITKADDLGIENENWNYESFKEEEVDYFGLRTYDEYCYFDSSHLILPQIENINLCSKNSWITV
jgi:hypothetical protein